MTAAQTPRDCQHGRLARKCDICDLERELAAVRGQLEEARQNGVCRCVCDFGEAGSVDYERPKIECDYHAKIRERAESALAAAKAEAEALRKDAVSLWKLLDDIDTASDRFKTNYEGLAKYVYFTQRKRFEIMTGEQFDAARGAEGK